MDVCRETLKLQEGEAVNSDKDCENEASHVQRLRQALSDEKDLKSRLDDQFLLKFLRARNFDHDRALSLVKNYYYQRIKYPEFFKKLRFSSYPAAFAFRGYGKLPGTDLKGRGVYFVTYFGEWDTSEIPISDVPGSLLLVLELVSEDEETQRNGVVFIIDAANFGFRHLRAFNPFIIAQINSMLINSFPIKYKRIHVLNAPSYFKICYSLIKPLLTKKLKKRLQFYGSDLSKLYEEVPREILPEEFGGLLGPVDNTELKNRIQNNDIVIERDSHYGYIVDNRY